MSVAAVRATMQVRHLLLPALLCSGCSDARLSDLSSITLRADPVQRSIGSAEPDVIRVELHHPGTKQEDCPALGEVDRAELNGVPADTFEPGGWQNAKTGEPLPIPHNPRCVIPSFLWPIPAGGGDATIVIEDESKRFEARFDAYFDPRTLEPAPGQSHQLRPGETVRLEYTPATDSFERFGVHAGGFNVAEDVVAENGVLTFLVADVEITAEPPIRTTMGIDQFAAASICEGVLDCRGRVQEGLPRVNLDYYR